MTAVELRPLPPEEAIAAFEAKGFRIGWSWVDVWQDEHARSFTVAKAMQLDILTAIRGEVQLALAEGRTFQQFAADLEPQLVKLGWWGRVRADQVPGFDPARDGDPTAEVQLGSLRRLRTIFDTNLRTSLAAGQWERIERLAQARPFLRYSAVLDRRTRPEHAAWHGTILPWDHEWWLTHMPPNGWHCRCTVQQLSQRDLDRRGWRVNTNPPPGGTRTYSHPRLNGGLPVQVPSGIDPGFGHNAGHNAGLAARREAAGRLAERIASAPPAEAAAAIGSVVGSRAFVDLLAGRHEVSMPVGRLDAPDLLAALELDGPRTVLLSAATVREHRGSHPGIQLADYARVAEILTGARHVLSQVRPGELPRLILMAPRSTGSEDWLRVVVKRTGDGREAFLLTLHELGGRKLRKALNRPEGTRIRWP